MCDVAEETYDDLDIKEISCRLSLQYLSPPLLLASYRNGVDTTRHPSQTR
jgi:hypothetical protein